MAKKTKAEPVSITTILNNPVDKKKLQSMIDEAVRCKFLIADQNESIKAIKDEALEQIGVEPKLFSSLVKIAYDNNYAEKQHELSDLDDAIELLFGTVDSNKESE